MTVVCSHAHYEARNPDERDYAVSLENTRRALWLRTHDALDGYVPSREFPCPGTLRVVHVTYSHRIIECDACRFETTTKVRVTA